MLDLAGGPRIILVRRFDGLDRVLGLDHAVEVEQAGLDFNDAAIRFLCYKREPLGGDVVVLPVVLAGGDHRFERLPVVDGQTEGLGRQGVQLQHRPERLAVRDRAELDGLREIGEITVVQSAVVVGGKALLIQNGQRMASLSGSRRGSVSGAHRNSYVAATP